MEAGHSAEGGNWGKFLVCRYDRDELLEPARFPGCQGQRLVDLRGPGRDHIWVLDLATGEGARFAVNVADQFTAKRYLDEHKVWVCPLFEPFLYWLYARVSESPAGWFLTLPRIVELPDAPFVLSGYRRPGLSPESPR